MEKTDWDYEVEYERLMKDYGIPEFGVLAEDFDVEKVLEKETLFLMREIRRVVVEKLSAYLHLFETLINPTSPPMFVFSVLKNLSSDEKEEIKSIYREISKIQISVMKLDTIYSEKSEGDFVKRIFDEWQKMKEKIYVIIEKFDKDLGESSSSTKNGYFN